jgi:hypothetical protein
MRAAFGVVFAIAGTAAQAQTYLQLPTAYGGSPTGAGAVTATVNGWKVTVYSCIQLNQGVNPANDCAGSQVAISVASNTLSLVFENYNYQNAPGQLLTTGQGSLYSDLSYSMIITAPTGLNIWSAGISLTGSVAPGDSIDQRLLSTGISSYAGLTTNLNASPVLKTVAVLPTNTTGTIAQDTKANPTGAITGDTPMNLTTQTDTFKAPEPISLSVLVVGLAGLGAARRRRYRTVPL